MGVFDTYGSTQLKAGDPWQIQYEVGDMVSIPDGVYFDPWEPGGPSNKAVVIEDGVFIAELDIFDYCGDAYRPQEKEGDRE